MSTLRLAIAISATLSLSPVGAQTANSGPGDPSLARLPGTPPNVTRTPSSVGPGRRATPGALPKVVTESNKEFEEDQKRIQRDMTICKGC